MLPLHGKLCLYDDFYNHLGKVPNANILLCYSSGFHLRLYNKQPD